MCAVKCQNSEPSLDEEGVEIQLIAWIQEWVVVVDALHTAEEVPKASSSISRSRVARG